VIRLALRVRRADAEVVLAELLELVPAGVEERDVSAGVVEYAVYGAPGELPALPDLRAVVGGALVDVATSEVADDWSERWREFHRPVTVGGRVHVRAPWHPAVDAETRATGLAEVVIDPGQAFGTGAHATTRMCLELLLGLDPRGALVDLGCGSGVLAIAAAKLGWDPVRGVDHDPLALAVTLDNARANGVDVEVARHDLLRDGPAPSAPTVLANLLGPLLRGLAAEGFAGESPRALVVSGLLVAEAADVVAAFAALGLDERERRTEGEWAALLLAPPSGPPERLDR
jgi:ribosomal protein L11 methyltransferase